MPKKPLKRPTKSRWPLYTVIGLLAACCGVYLLYWNIDAYVGAQLERRQIGGVSAVYSDMAALDSDFPIALIIKKLEQRRYQQVDQGPLADGQYIKTATGVSIKTRSFIDAAGKRQPSNSVSISSEHSKNRVQFSLEPQMLAALGDSDQRSSELHPLSDFPQAVKDAVLSIEDERFYSHFGIDIIGTLRAVVKNIFAGKIRQGGSTITQQLAKNLFFSSEKSIKRKILEAFAAISLERRFSKDKILEMYLNEVYLGQEGSIAFHGFPATAKSLFGKEIKDLKTHEAALLAGLIQAPSLYAPRRYPLRAKKRRDIVLQKMFDLGKVSDQELVTNSQEPLGVLKTTLTQKRAQHFVAALEQSLSPVVDMQTAALQGVRILTGIDLELQTCAEQAFDSYFPQLEKKYPRIARKKKTTEAALVAIEPFSGKVRAWIGGRDFATNQFDHVQQAHRQIGSTIKPFLYITALDKNLNSYRVATPISILSDVPLQVGAESVKNYWNPENYDHEYRGDVTVRYALEHSLNIPAVQVLQRIGIPAFVKTLKQFNVADSVPPVPALALGALDTTLLQLTAAYGAFANGGIYITPRLYTSVLDTQDDRISETVISEQRVADEAASYVLTNILQGVVERGTAASIRQTGYKGPAAGKTGTSNESRDAWFVGFTPELVTGIWIGFDDNKPLGITGGAAAAPLWAEFMKCVAIVQPLSNFIPPPGVIFAEIDPDTGIKVGPACRSEKSITEVFVKGTEPRESCSLQGNLPSEEIQKDVPDNNGNSQRQKSIWENIFGR